VRLRTAFIASLLALLVVVQANAAGRAHITLQINETFLVAGTDLACQTEVGKHVLPGQKLVTCFKVKGNGLAVGSYASALGTSGRVVVAKIKPDGSVGAPVFNRVPASLRAGAKQITAHAGDQLLLSGTDIACTINTDAGVYPTCFRFTTSGGRAHSYAFAETEKFVAVVQFDTTGKKSKLVFKRAQP
jgi:hypothetical protein